MIKKMLLKLFHNYGNNDFVLVYTYYSDIRFYNLFIFSSLPLLQFFQKLSSFSHAIYNCTKAMYCIFKDFCHCQRLKYRILKTKCKTLKTLKNLWITMNKYSNLHFTFCSLLGALSVFFAGIESCLCDQHWKTCWCGGTERSMFIRIV